MKGWHYASSDEERRERARASAARFRERNRKRLRKEARERYNLNPKRQPAKPEKIAAFNVVLNWCGS